MANTAGPSQRHQHQQKDISPAERLSARWNKMFRTDGNLLYDTLLWTSNDWPLPAVQWQSGSWQLPEYLQELQQQAAADAEEEALAGYELDETAAALDDDPEKDEEMADADNSTGPAAAQRRNRSNRQWMSGGKQLLPMPLDFQYLVTGDQTNGQEAANLVLWRVRLPGQLPAGFDPAVQQLAMVQGEIEPVLSIPHGMLDINRLHSMPSKQQMVATCCDQPQIYLFNLQRQAELQQQQQNGIRSGSNSGSDAEDDNATPSRQSSDSAHSQPQSEAVAAVLGGRQAGGYALEWNPVLPGLLLAADVAGGVQLYDLQRGSSSSSSSSGSGQPQIQPLQSCSNFASCAINDVSWHSGGSTFAAATEDGQLLLQDVREPTAGSSRPQLAAAAGSSSATAAAAGSSAWGLRQLTAEGVRAARVHVRRNRGSQTNQPPDCLTVDFDPNHPHRLATGGKDGYVYVLDMRRLAQPLEKLSLHAGDVRQVSWSRGVPGLLASAGEDDHVLLWDVHKMKHSLRKQQQQGTAAAAAGGGGLGLPQPRKTHLSDALAQLSQPGLLFVHQGHIAAVEGLAWNPDRPWILASSSASAWAANAAGEDEMVQPGMLMVWEVNRSCGLLC